VFRLDDGAVKLTTALWFTPSGRSINQPRPQSAPDGGEPLVTTDSVPRPAFQTDAGRVVLGGGGIVPDVEVPTVAVTKADRALQAALGAKVPLFRDVMVDYALSLKAAGTVPDAQFVVTPAMRDELYRRLQRRAVEVPRAVYDSAAPLVTQALGSQIARYVFGPRAQAARSLRQDPTLAKAMQLLQNVDSPTALIERGRRK
jgi:carboxyl-terminal processing protease